MRTEQEIRELDKFLESQINSGHNNDEMVKQYRWQRNITQWVLSEGII